MRIFLLAIALVLIALPALSEPVAVFEPGKSTGIELLDNDDGHWKPTTAGGRDAVALTPQTQPPSYYLYFRLSPEVRQKVGSEVFLVVDFYDEGLGGVKVEYNGDPSPYTPVRGFIVVGSGEWVRSVVPLRQARFMGAQNGGADFRLVHMGQLTISKLEVWTEDPKLELPNDKERVMKGIKQVERPRDMYYTFGCEVDDETGPIYRFLGATSIESYVTWESCEKKALGAWDWSHWDDTVRVLKENDLKWVPFLILSPAYSTPNWFRASKDHFPCRCLEHGTDSKIESLWNPHLPKYIDRFLKEFAARYRDSGVIESVLLGIQGDFGEAIYSVWGGGWTFDIPGTYHNHAGFWCDDPYALADFRKFMQSRYKKVAALNKAWGAGFKRIEDVDFPGRKDGLKAFREALPSAGPGVRRWWLDFVDWYRDSMTRWSEWWIAATRRHFPRTPIYLCTGGDAPPEHGSDFAEQCRVAAKHKAGVRITNEASNYAANFAITRWVAAAGKHYGAYYGFEPAGAEDEKGIVARIYNATASGANQLHDYANNVIQSKPRVDAQRRHLKYLFRVPAPVVPVALWYPNVSMTLAWGGYLEKAMQLRDYTDYDYVDETMLRSKALDRYKVLVILHGQVMETRDARIIADWAGRGGRVVVMDVARFESVEATPEPETILFGDTPQGRSVGSGDISRAGNWGRLAATIRSALRGGGLPVCDLNKDGVYSTQIGPDRFLFLNTTDKDVEIKVSIQGAAHTATTAADTITPWTPAP